MRPRKDPGIRQEAFIKAATELFMDKGYESVSVRDVLDAVGDKTASPSVFYYYFPSKDKLYHACVEAVAEDYISTMNGFFSMEGKTPVQWMLDLVYGLELYMVKEGNLISSQVSATNRLFILDMRDRVTRKMGLIWAEALPAFSVPEAEALELARFLAGGIGAMMFDCMEKGALDGQEAHALVERIVSYAMNVIGFPEGQRLEMLKALKEVHNIKG